MRGLPVPEDVRCPLVGSLPRAPYDGQEVYYIASSAFAVVWHLRYRADSPVAFKWEYLGGPPLSAQQGAGGNQTTANNAAYTAMTTTPSLTLALAGAYNLSFDGAIQLQAAALGQANVSLALNGAQYGLYGLLVGSDTFDAVITGSEFGASVAAGTIVTGLVSTNNQPFTFTQWRIRATPIAVSG